jgi:hypothetical protein
MAGAERRGASSARCDVGPSLVSRARQRGPGRGVCRGASGAGAEAVARGVRWREKGARATVVASY